MATLFKTTIMKKLIFLLIVSSFLISCGSSNNSLSQFSKRKYLKKYKSAKRVKDDPINTYAIKPKETPKTLYAAEEIQPKHFVLKEVEANDFSELVLPQTQQSIPLKRGSTESIPKHENKTILKAEKEIPIKRKLHPWSIATIVTFGLVLLSAGIYFVIEKFLIFFVFIFLLLLIINWAIGTIALIKINKFPKKYKGRGWSAIAITLGVISSLLLFVASLAMQNYGV